MEEIVAHPGVTDRCLGRDGLERGMGADAGEGSEPSGIGTAEHADLAVVAGNVLHQPVDGVEGVGGLVDAVRVLRVPLRAEGYEIAAGPEAPADVLAHEDVAVLGELAVRRGRCAESRARGGERGTNEQNGKRRGVVLRDQGDGEEGDAIADRNGELVRRWNAGGARAAPDCATSDGGAARAPAPRATASATSRTGRRECSTVKLTQPPERARKSGR